MANTYTDYKNAKYNITTNSKGDITSSQFFELDTGDNEDNPTATPATLPVNPDGSTTVQVGTIAENNAANDADSTSGDQVTYDPGFANGSQTLTLNSLYHDGQNTGFVDATLQSPGGGTETLVMQQTPYHTDNGQIMFIPNQTDNVVANGQVATSEQNGNAYAYVTDTNYTTSNDVPSTITATSNGNSFTPATSAADVPADATTQDPACFTTGTPILTPRGDVAVEDLRVGDEVVTASGAHRRIRWIGQRHMRCDNLPAHLRSSVTPVCISAHAIAPGVPARDIRLSPGHAVALTVDGADVLVPVSVLVNGATVTQPECRVAHYWHVELDSHDVLMSAGLRSESFIDVGNRHTFAIGAEGLDPERTPATLADYALPFHDNGAVVVALRAQLAARAQELGWHLAEADCGLHLMVDGQRVDPVIAGGLTHFSFPATARRVSLHSTTFRPGLLGHDGHGDPRDLGVQVHGAWMAGATLGLDHPLLAGVFHPNEARDGCAWRWTTGMGTLPSGLWAGKAGRVTLSLDVTHTTHTGWHLPHEDRRNVA
ncbi:hypothetical protein CFR73_07015 [Novacetimonas maltaceti]|uniref:Hedgehog/Intein (Hint) domain-containing protein n=1 Tax=Novacetimonas maltaceti TaxID=1203393 RepID=A0A2S3VZI3_9PROT|nr:Hint domain-containing protein [Novacetimonas maltaceti]POF62044.1 hypothetical protein KMAL_23250 [Novacetimonas maltaceti]PYD60411.1 hypothetical protein CFR73_07015 [Novacetimonas maltaceti]